MLKALEYLKITNMHCVLFLLMYSMENVRNAAMFWKATAHVCYAQQSDYTMLKALEIHVHQKKTVCSHFSTVE